MTYIVYIGRMTPPPSDTKKEQEVFKKSVQTWIAEQKITKKELSRVLDVSYGTVRNWFSSDLGIGEESRKKLEKLMKNPSMLKEKAETPDEVVCWWLRPYEANLAMWRSAADADDVDFNQGQYAQKGADAKRFAKWSTATIIKAIKEELKKHPIKEVQQLANAVRFVEDPISKIESAKLEYEQQSDEDRERLEQGIPIKLPVFHGKINNLYLELATKCAKMDKADFIAKALNDDANKAFGDELAEFLNSETSLEERENEVPPLQEDDDIPF